MPPEKQRVQDEEFAATEGVTYGDGNGNIDFTHENVQEDYGAEQMESAGNDPTLDLMA